MHVAAVSHDTDSTMETSPGSYRDLESAIEWSRFNLKLVGAWPEFDDENKESTLWSKYEFLLPILLVVVFISLPQTISLMRVWGDMDLVIENLSTANISVTTATLKLLFLCCNRKVIKPLLGNIVDDWLREKSEEDRRVMLKTAQTARKINISSAVGIYGTAVIFVVLRVFLNIRNRAAANGSEPIHLLMFQSYFPYNTQVSPNFELTWLGQFFATLYTCNFYTGVDCFIAMLVLHLCGQIKVLRLAIERFMSNVADQNADEFQEKLALIVRRHEHLNNFAESLENLISPMLLGQLLTYTVQFCFQGFEIIKTLEDDRGEGSLILQLTFMGVYIAAMLLHFYVYCYIGEMLSSESEGIGITTYESSWYELSAREANNLILIMYRAKRPLKITAGKFFSLSMTVFSAVSGRPTDQDIAVELSANIICSHTRICTTAASPLRRNF